MVGDRQQQTINRHLARKVIQILTASGSITTERLRWVQNVSRLLLTRRSSASTMRATSCRKVVLRVQPIACSAFNGFPHNWLRSAGGEKFLLNTMKVGPRFLSVPPPFGPAPSYTIFTDNNLGN